MWNSDVLERSYICRRPFCALDSCFITKTSIKITFNFLFICYIETSLLGYTLNNFLFCFNLFLDEKIVFVALGFSFSKNLQNIIPIRRIFSSVEGSVSIKSSRFPFWLLIFGLFI